MANHSLWRDEYWLLLMQLYLKPPQGVKQLYSKPLVDLALELHIHPEFLHRQMFRLRQIDTPRMQRLWDTYGQNPRKLARGIKLLRKMNGFGNADAFYAGVEVSESWEKDFKPIEFTKMPGIGLLGGQLTADDSEKAAPKGRRKKHDPQALTPAKLIMILDLYFRLTTITMVPETPEIIELARLIHSTPREVADVMEVYQVCDPYITHEDLIVSPLLGPCMQVWKRFGNEDPEKLAALAAQLKAYWLS